MKTVRVVFFFCAMLMLATTHMSKASEEPICSPGVLAFLVANNKFCTNSGEENLDETSNQSSDNEMEVDSESQSVEKEEKRKHNFFAYYTPPGKPKIKIPITIKRLKKKRY